MALLRTSRLWAVQMTAPPGAHTVYTVPAGKRAILRAADFVVIIGAGLTTEVEVDLSVGPPGEDVAFFHGIITREAQTISYRGHMVAYPGEQFIIVIGATFSTSQGSGALMDEPN